MKKLLVTGGVLFAVMPAFAASLPEPFIAADAESVSCTGNGFNEAHPANNPLQMQALFVTNTCGEGEYLQVTGDSLTINNDGTISNATCATCDAGHYCPTLTNANIPVTDNQLQSYGMYACATGSFSSSGASTCSPCTGATYTNEDQSACSSVDSGYYANAEHSDQIQCIEGYRDGAGVETIDLCSATCSLNGLNGTDHASTYALVANTATYGDGLITQQFCEKVVAENGCAAGYERTSATASIGGLLLTGSDVSYSQGNNGATWTATILNNAAAPITSVGGVAKCKTSELNNQKIGCFMRATSLNGNAINGTVLEVAQYDDMSECSAACGDITDTDIAAFFDGTNGNKFATMVDGRYFCTPSTVNINWGKDSENQDITSTCTFGVDFELPESKPSKADHKFIGWKVTVTPNNDQNNEPNDD